MRLARIVAGLGGICLAGVLGCGGGGPKYAKVSGRVTLNGVPYPNAVVSFQPIAAKGEEAGGRGSSGLTDTDGRFTLTTDTGEKGAAVGKHRVRIVTKRDGNGGAIIDPSVGSPDNAEYKFVPDPIPPEWFAVDGNKTFEVPPKGTDEANFDIVNPKFKTAQ